MDLFGYIQHVPLFTCICGLAIWIEIIAKINGLQILVCYYYYSTHIILTTLVSY